MQVPLLLSLLAALALPPPSAFAMASARLDDTARTSDAPPARASLEEPATAGDTPRRRDDEDAQAGPAELKVTVVDQTGAALITATVTLVDATGTARTFAVDERGQAVVTGLAAGPYTLAAGAEAFETFEGPITLKRGANSITLSLPLAGLAEDEAAELANRAT